MMTNEDFATARQLLFMTRKELAENVLGISCRMVNYIEEGKRKIPKDIEEKMVQYIDLRYMKILELTRECVDKGNIPKDFELKENGLNEFISKKIMDSVYAHFLNFSLKCKITFYNKDNEKIVDF